MFEGIFYHLQYSVRSALAVGVWKERQIKGEARRVVFVCFFFGFFLIAVVFALYLYLVSARRGIDKGNKIGKAHDTLRF